MNLTQISEEFLHYIWKTQSFDKKDLKTFDGESLHIVYQGVHNHDAGPDFFSGKIKLQNTLWAGNIELHIRTSDWLKHKHQNDAAYDNVILHVVYENDHIITHDIGKEIPTLELKNLIPKNIFENYLQLKISEYEFPCEGQLTTVPDIIINTMLQKAAVERIEQKIKDVERIFESANNDWEECFYILLARYFGAKVNSDAFERLARSTSSKILLKHSNDRKQIEAMLLGQSGLLPVSHKNNIVQEWISEYQFLQSKYSLNSLKSENWKFARMRPISFPTIRISQFAQLIYKKEKLFSFILDSNDINELINIFELEASSYWDNHYHFNKDADHKKKKIGNSTRNMIIINAVVSMLYFYGEKMNLQEYKDKAISLLEALKTESNKITRLWKSNNVIAKDALQSQGLLQLKKTYCDHNRCLECSIGNHIIKGR